MIKSPVTSSRTWPTALYLSALCLCLYPTPANACSIPVFRYALDRWTADAYRLEITPGAPSDPAIAVLLRNLGDSSPLNLVVVASTNAHESRLLFPEDETTVWSGPLNSTVFAELTDSPARTEIVRRLVAGDSGVWVFLESGQTHLDASEAARLEKRLRFLETVATLPAMDPTDPSNQLGPGPELRVGFSVLRLRSDDKQEAVLRKMLIRIDPANVPASDGPIAAVVFGRGRVLGAWPMKELGDEAIDEAALFLLGACSCQVKRLNPGWDLLLSVNWDEALHAVAAAAEGNAEADSGREEQASAPVETVTIHPGAAQDPNSRRDELNSRRPLLGISAGIALLAAALLLYRVKRTS